MHAGVDFNVNFQTLHTGANQCLQRLKTINHWLQLILLHLPSRPAIRIHHHNRNSNPRISQSNSLVDVSHPQIVYGQRLQGAGRLKTAAPVAKSLHHTHHLFALANPLLEIQVIVLQRVQIDFQPRLMQPRLHPIRHPLQSRISGTLD